MTKTTFHKVPLEILLSGVDRRENIGCRFEGFARAEFIASVSQLLSLLGVCCLELSLLEVEPLFR